MTRSELDEPVQRYFHHAIRARAEPGRGVSLAMSGRIRVGPWLPFSGVRLRIDPRGAVRSAWAQRWRGDSGYVTCGCEVHAERRWGDLVVPSAVTVGWDFGTPAYRPFFSAQIEELAENY